jgi:hypothetical protein
MTEEIVGTIVGGLILAVLGWAWHKRQPIRRWWASQADAANQQEKRTEADQLAVLRGQVRDVARDRGEVIPVSSSGGGNPTIVTYSDGQKSAFYRDHGTYTSDMNARRTDPLRSSVVRGPLEIPLSRWSRQQCQTWLDERNNQP